jgi:ubiquinone/menaquinone biosynthesis C-methylase UbiE
MPRAQTEFWSQVATQYDDVVDAQLGKNVRPLIKKRLSQEKSLGHAVEIGCGSGYFTRALAGKSETVVATDFAPGMIDMARAALATCDNVRFQTEDCQNTTFADRTFDTVFMSLVLQFVDADRALGEMHRILKPGANLIVANLDVQELSMPLRLLFLLRTLYHARVTYRRPLPHVPMDRLLAEKQLRAKLERAGFQVTSCEQIRDPSCAWNCPVTYCKAVRL